MVSCPVSMRRDQMFLAQSSASQDMTYRGDLWNPVTSPRGEDLILPNSALSNLSIYVSTPGQVSKCATTNQDSHSMQRGAVCSPAPLPWLWAAHSAEVFSSCKVCTVLCKSGPWKIKIRLLLKNALLWKKRGQNWFLKILYRQGNKAHPHSLSWSFLV